MTTTSTADCVVCRKHRGEVTAPGGPIYEDDLVYVAHALRFGDEVTHYLGHVFVETKRHVAGLGDLTEAEAQRVGLLTSRAARALVEVLGMAHVYSFVFGDHVPHVHVHVIGKYPGAPEEYRGVRVDDWPDAPRGDDAQIAGANARLREFFTTTWPTC